MDNIMNNLTNFERSIIVHALFKYAEYLRTFDYPFPSLFLPESIEKLALKINESYQGVNHETDK